MCVCVCMSADVCFRQCVLDIALHIADEKEQV